MKKKKRLNDVIQTTAMNFIKKNLKSEKENLKINIL